MFQNMLWNFVKVLRKKRNQGSLLYHVPSRHDQQEPGTFSGSQLPLLQLPISHKSATNEPALDETKAFLNLCPRRKALR